MAANRPVIELSLADARRLALRAQGFGSARPKKPNRGHLRRLLDQLGSLQIDAVNVLERAHYLPAFTRLGPYDRAALDDLVYRRGEGFEYMTHAASVATSGHHRLWRWRMAQQSAAGWWSGAEQAIEARNPGYVARVLSEIDERGPLSFTELTDAARRERGPSKYAESSLLWASKQPSDGKAVLEGLWLAGRLAVAGRTSGFERRFDLTERVVMPEAIAAPTAGVEEAHRELAKHALAALGVGWVKDVAEYHRLKVAPTRAALRGLAADGEATRVGVEGLDGEIYADPTTLSTAGAVRARPVSGQALLGPFDSLLWERSRVERLFGFTHSFEIYVPEAKRRYGYYVLPFLLGDSLVARADLKAARAGSRLLVRSAHLEPGQSPGDVVGPLAAELRSLAGWLGLDDLHVERKGDLATRLEAAVR